MDEELTRRLKSEIERTGRSLRDVSLSAGMSPDAVRGILRHPDSSPTVSTVRKLSHALDVSPEWLAFGTSGADESTKRVPILSWVSAGSFRDTDAVSDLDDFRTIELSGLGKGRWLALQVEGDSMDRISPPGSIIVFNAKDRNLVPNACYIIANEEGAATYKRYRPSPDRFEPVSVNPNHEPIFPNDLVRVIGRVRRSILEM